MGIYGKTFMSHRGRAIRYERTEDGDIIYLVAKGDRTDAFFSDWKDAMVYIDKIKDGKKSMAGGIHE